MTKIAGVCISAGVLILMFLALAVSPIRKHSLTERIIVPSGAAATSRADVKIESRVDRPSVIRFVANPEAMPPVTLRDLDGRPVSSAALAGKVVLLNFWATWCVACRQEIPGMIALQSHYKNDLQIIGVSVDDEPAKAVKQFVAKQAMNYPVVMQNDKLLAAYGSVAVLPTTFVVSPAGRIVQKHSGLVAIEEYDLEIRALLKMPVEARIETVADNGQIFAKNASELPGVDMSMLTPAQKRAALKRMNSEGCTCPCKLTIAECRLNDSKCETSQGLAAKITKSLQTGRVPTT